MCNDCRYVPEGDIKEQNKLMDCYNHKTDMMDGMSVKSSLHSSNTIVNCNKIDVNESIPIIFEGEINKDISLMASLYSQIEFLRSQIQFLNTEIIEKNVVIRSLLNINVINNTFVKPRDKCTYSEGKNNGNASGEIYDTMADEFIKKIKNFKK